MTISSDGRTDDAPTAPSVRPSVRRSGRHEAQDWVVVSPAGTPVGLAGRPPSIVRVLAELTAAALVVLLVVAVIGAFASRNVAEREAMNDAAQMTDLLAQSVVQPALDDRLLTGDAAATAAFDDVVRTRVLGPTVLRVKLWLPDGTVLYSDEPRVVGQRFDLGEEEREVLSSPSTHVEVSDLSRPENRFEAQDSKLLEVYRPVWTPSGQELLFETYLPYDRVAARTSELWRGFAGITLTSLLFLLVLMLPILWRLLDRTVAEQARRVALLEHAVDASAAERRRIAATLHDGVVQELAAASFTVGGAAARAEADGDGPLASRLHEAAAAVRSTIGGLRSLLVDIYPPSLASSGLVAVLTDLAATARTRDIAVTLQVPDDGRSGLDEAGERLVYRVAQESLRNATKHSAAQEIVLALTVEPKVVRLTVADDGIGFDAAAVLAEPPEGHLGLQVMHDLAAAEGALLEVSSAPGEGTTWRLTVTRP